MGRRYGRGSGGENVLGSEIEGFGVENEGRERKVGIFRKVRIDEGF